MTTNGEKMEATTVAVTNVSVTSLVNNEDASRTPPTAEAPSTPPITTSQSAEYCHRLAEITSRATLTDPLNIVFAREKNGHSTPVTPEQLYIGALRRVETMVAGGGFVVESGNFAAVACWQPPTTSHPTFTETQLQEMAAEGRPIFAHFLREIQAAQRECFGDAVRPPTWWLSLMARDPGRKDKGAVRAVIEPFVKRAREEKAPVWLVAGNERARDVYAYFGFRVVRVMKTFVPGDRKEGPGVNTWCMVCNWPLQ